MRPIFASKVAFLFRELPDYTEDIKTKWDLFESAVITSAVLVVVAKVWEVKWVVRKELLGGTKKLKKLSVQRNSI